MIDKPIKKTVVRNAVLSAEASSRRQGIGKVVSSSHGIKRQ
jgi:hypothetical protein